MYNFCENISLLFSSQYPDFCNHPMYPIMASFGYIETPGEEEGSSPKTNSKESYSLVTQKLNQMNEAQKNQLNCDALFCIYLRDVARQVNSQYYSTMCQFVLMFRDCLNLYGWQKRAENECKSYYG